MGLRANIPLLLIVLVIAGVVFFIPRLLRNAFADAGSGLGEGLTNLGGEVVEGALGGAKRLGASAYQGASYAVQRLKDLLFAGDVAAAPRTLNGPEQDNIYGFGSGVNSITDPDVIDAIQAP